MSEQEMDPLEQALAKAMQRLNAPEGFAERVMGRAYAAAALADETVMLEARGTHVSEARHGARRVLVMRGARAWMGGAIAAALVLGALGAEQVHVRREREQAALATRQFEAAVLVTDQALQQTREQLARVGLKLGD